MIKVRHVIGCAALMLGSQYIATPAQAEDTEKTGLLAALGIEAAGGETTLGDNGGQIEGYLLASGTMNEAAETILGQIRASYGDRPMLLLTREEAVNLNVGTVLSQRIHRLRIAAIEAAATCKAAAKQKAGGGYKAALDSSGTETPDNGTKSGPNLMGKDIAGLARTDQTIAGFDIALGERALINAIGAANRKGKPLDLRLVSDMVAAPADSPIVGLWNALESEVAALEPCASIEKPAASMAAAVKGAAAVVARFGALKTYALTPGDKGAPSPLEQAAALGDITTANPRLLRVAVEKVGGTTVTRSNIFLKLGLPGAVVVSGGLVAGYRVVDPATGRLEASGTVLCAIPQKSFGKVPTYVLRGDQATAPDGGPVKNCVPLS
jgi:hypothetical protein